VKREREKISEIRKKVDEQMVKDRDARWAMKVYEALRERGLRHEKNARTNGKRTRTNTSINDDELGDSHDTIQPYELFQRSITRSRLLVTINGREERYHLLAQFSLDCRVRCEEVQGLW